MIGILTDGAFVEGREFRYSGIGRCGTMTRRKMTVPHEPLKVGRVVETLFAEDLHAKRVLSIANGVVGVLDAAVLSVHAIGRAYAKVAGGDSKHGVKQVDRLLSNPGIDVWALFGPWTEYVVGPREEIVIALDWTEFDPDDHATLAAYLITSHGRATPLIWMTVQKSTLEGQRNAHEYRVIERLHACLAPNVKVVLLADRGFGDQKLYALLQMLGWDFVIRFREAIQVEVGGVRQPAAKWVPPTGRATMLRNAKVTTRGRTELPAVVVVRAKAMKEAWCLATTLKDRKAGDVVKLYGKRFTIEETFRDQKNLHFGLGLSATHIRDTARRDRLLLLAALAQALLTLLGAAGEECGLDKHLKTNTSKKRTRSLLNQGLDWYGAIPNMKPERLALLMKTFDTVVRRHAIFREVFGVI